MSEHYGKLHRPADVFKRDIEAHGEVSKLCEELEQALLLSHAMQCGCSVADIKLTGMQGRLRGHVGLDRCLHWHVMEHPNRKSQPDLRCPIVRVTNST